MPVVLRLSPVQTFWARLSQVQTFLVRRPEARLPFELARLPFEPARLPPVKAPPSVRAPRLVAVEEPIYAAAERLDGVVQLALAVGRHGHVLLFPAEPGLVPERVVEALSVVGELLCQACAPAVERRCRPDRAKACLAVRRDRGHH